MPGYFGLPSAEQLGSAPSTTSTGLTANVVGTQAAATLLPSVINEVEFCAAADHSVKFTSLVEGACKVVLNKAAFRCAVFPAVGNDLGNGVDAGTHLNPGQEATWVALDGVWVELVGPHGLLQKRTAVGNLGGIELSSSGFVYVETSLQLLDFRPRYSSSVLRVRSIATHNSFGDGGSDDNKDAGVAIFQDSTGGLLAPANGTVVITGVFGGRLAANSTAQALQQGNLVLEKEGPAVDRVIRTFTQCMRGSANSVEVQFINADEFTSTLTVEEFRP